MSPQKPKTKKHAKAAPTSKGAAKTMHSHNKKTAHKANGTTSNKRPKNVSNRSQNQSSNRTKSHTNKLVNKQSSITNKKGFCPVEKQCGACQLLPISYEKQLERKDQYIIELFEDFAEEETIFDPILGMENPFYYRNKVVSPYAPGKKIKARKNQQKRRHEPLNYEVLCGMYKQGTHHIIATDDCLLENKQAKKVILTVRDLISSFAIDAYNEDTGEGFMRHAIVRIGHSSGEVLVTLVTNGRNFPGSKAFIRELVKRCPFITTVVQNINTRQTNVILGDQEQTLYGPGFILDTLCGLSFRISSHSFYQVNATQTEVLYRRAIELAELTGTETVLDAYCGTGTIGLVAAAGLDSNPNAKAKRVIGVDNVEEAIIDARNNAKHNGIENAEFFAEDASEFMTRLAQNETASSNQNLKNAPKSNNKKERTIDVLLMDPPRAGSTEEFLDAACAMNPKRIVYISCNPKTQVRDAQYLIGKGFVIDRIQAVDMFPHTEHVENIIVLSRN